jgi:hypothetical protein
MKEKSLWRTGSRLFIPERLERWLVMLAVLNTPEQNMEVGMMARIPKGMFRTDDSVQEGF